MRGAELVAICDNDRPKARALAERFGIRDTFTDIEDLLEVEDLDAVVIATPNHLHEPHVLSALASKRHVMCERPLRADTPAASNTFSPRQRAPIARSPLPTIIGIALTCRRSLGSCRAESSARHSPFRCGAYSLKRPAEGWRQRRAESGGGALLDHGVPLLDLALWLTDYPEPVRVSAHMDRGRGAGAVEEAMTVQLGVRRRYFDRARRVVMLHR